MRSNTSLYGVVKEGIASLDIQTKILKIISTKAPGFT